MCGRPTPRVCRAVQCVFAHRCRSLVGQSTLRIDSCPSSCVCRAAQCRSLVGPSALRMCSRPTRRVCRAQSCFFASCAGGCRCRRGQHFLLAVVCVVHLSFPGIVCCYRQNVILITERQAQTTTSIINKSTSETLCRRYVLMITYPQIRCVLL